eukprot:TRINITY_DN5259_c0_g1_i4.p1 TRINITY_DN5259_c0_g1~~TRINITY_DN5259_c0_g1_i4.p1  ORF type:complete len:551 (-),score=100.48 TRINITY_DN5259_c0_g1_i4:92-1690(-)
MDARTGRQANGGCAQGLHMSQQVDGDSAQSRRPPPVQSNIPSQRRGTSSLSGSIGPPADTGEEDTIADSQVAPRAEPEPEVCNDGCISLSTCIEYSALPLGHTQDVFGLVTVQAAEVANATSGASSGVTDRKPMDLVFVLDVSGSMEGEKMRDLQAAVRFVIDQASAADRMSIVTFENAARRVLRLRRMDSAGKDDANGVVMRLEAGGGTSIAAGLREGLDIVERRRQRNVVTAILLLTDGQDQSARSSIGQLASRARSASCALYAFGFGNDHDAALLSELAELAQTPFSYIEESDKIRDAFAGAVGGLASVVVQGVKVSLTFHVSVKAIHTPFTVTRVSDSDSMVVIPDMFAGERRDVVVELAAPASSSNEGETVMLLEASAQYADIKRNCLLQTAVVGMEARCLDAAEPQPEVEPNEEVTAQRERVEVTRALREAAEQSDAGQFEQAQQVLEEADQRMKSHPVKTAVADALAVELQDARDRMMSKAVWERGGRAEVCDAAQMHAMQRCTNTAVSSSSRVQKSSKKMYFKG